MWHSQPVTGQSGHHRCNHRQSLISAYDLHQQAIPQIMLHLHFIDLHAARRPPAASARGVAHPHKFGINVAWATRG
jgi:hypothetical protein